MLSVIVRLYLTISKSKSFDVLCKLDNNSSPLAVVLKDSPSLVIIFLLMSQFR